MYNKINTYFENKQPLFVATLSFIFVLVTGLFDYYTGYELSFSIFYMVPISLAAWFSGRMMGVFISMFSAFVWFNVDHFSGHIYTNAAIPFWNGFVRLGFFILITLLLSEVKFRLKNETELARKDNLTGLMNARFFKDTTYNQMEIAIRHNHQIVIGYIDLDNFKTINDTSGHSEGDRVLKAVGDVINNSLRISDLAGRLGGDEFAVFLPETDRDGAELVFTKIHEKLAEEVKNNNWPVGFSIGVAIFKNIPLHADDALKFADSLMYKVKKSGKNNILYKEYSMD